MSLGLFYKDEFKGFYKSKVMIVLWVGMPSLPILMHFILPDTEGFPITAFVGVLIASLGGTLSSVMLSTTIVNEKTNHVYDLFLIRPIKRSNLILAKYLAVYSCLVIATILSLLVGILIDITTLDITIDVLFEGVWDSLAISLAAMSISCSAGILIGILINSVSLAAILSIYLGNQLSLIAILPGVMIEKLDPVLFSALVGVVATLILLFVIVKIFNKKSL